MNTYYIVFGIIGVILLWAVFVYNNFVSLVNRVKESWSDIEVQFKRRYDLIPNLVETVKGYATHERAAFDSVTQARAAAMGAQSVADHDKAENMLTGALKSLFAVSEAYPDLKANTNFLELQRELSDTENKIQAARRFYNSVVQDLNTSLQSFPSNIIGSIFGFSASEFFQLGDADVAAKEPVKVSF
jgi:LemA protein